MKAILVLFILVKLGASKAQSDDVLQLVKEAGYKGEAHQVQTVDGYLLKVHRILPKNKATRKFPVFLMHGLMAASSDFVMTGPKIALAYYLADNGFDVWMGNARGNKHSTNHTRLSADSREFWTFSWHEIGFYDLPAMIDFVLAATGALKTFYVGHSQGTTSLLVFLSMHPEYNRKITQAHLLTPAAFMAHLPNPAITTLAPQIRNGFFGNYRYINLENMWRLLDRQFCSQPRWSPQFQFCTSILLAVGGPNRKAIVSDLRILPTLVHHISPRISVMQLVHYIQSYFSGKFQTFDHRWKNFEDKNASLPVDYPVEKVSAPIYIYAGTVDALVSIVVSLIVSFLSISVSFALNFHKLK